MKKDDIRIMAHDIIERQAVEDDYIEYKKTARFSSSILKTVCAYANNYMNREIGLLFIGIEEVNSESGEKAIPVRPISGIKESLIETTENELKSLISNVHPKITYHLIQDEIDGKKYIVLAVEPGNSGPYETSRKAEEDKDIKLKAERYIRVNRDSRKPNNREEFELLKKFAGFHFSSELNETATLDDLSYEYMKEYLVRTNAASDIKALSKLDMARAMHLISDSEYGGYRAKNFAVLMFSERPEVFIPEAKVVLIREAIGTDKMESKAFNGPIWIQAQQVIRYFRDTIQSSYNIRDRVTNDTHVVYNWPETMFNELAVNCILHKEYSNNNYIGIYWYSDHLVFINHNRPLPPVTIESMNNNTEFNDRQYLNTELKEMFYNLGLIQSYGSGIRRAKQAMEDNHSPKLLFEPANELDDYTMVTAYINEEFDRIHNEENAKPEVVNSTQKTTQEVTQEVTQEIDNSDKAIPLDNRILILISKTPTITRNALSRILGVSPETVKYHIKKLKDSGRLRREGSTKSGYWVIK